ncbi:hypothetical protein, partial [Microcoleus anatoxicus]
WGCEGDRNICNFTLNWYKGRSYTVKKHIKYMCFFILIVELAIAIWCLATQSQKRMERACYQVYTNHGIFKDFVKLLLLYYQCAPNPA